MPGSALSIRIPHCGSTRWPLRGALPARADRAALQKALDYARDGDVLIVWRLDRLGRSLPHLIETVSAQEKRTVGFRSCAFRRKAAGHSD
jgi:DNA invertase Pin-like site-specific DNA recombinase